EAVGTLMSGPYPLPSVCVQAGGANNRTFREPCQNTLTEGWKTHEPAPTLFNYVTRRAVGKTQLRQQRRTCGREETNGSIRDCRVSWIFPHRFAKISRPMGLVPPDVVVGEIHVASPGGVLVNRSGVPEPSPLDRQSDDRVGGSRTAVSPRPIKLEGPGSPATGFSPKRKMLLHFGP